MTGRTRHIVLVPKHIPTELFSIEEVAERCNVNIGYVEKLFRLGIIDPEPHTTRLFPPRVTIRVRKVVRLQEDLGINPQGAAVVLELIDKIDTLRAEVRKLSGEF